MTRPDYLVWLLINPEVTAAAAAAAGLLAEGRHQEMLDGSLFCSTQRETAIDVLSNPSIRPNACQRKEIPSLQSHPPIVIGDHLIPKPCRHISLKWRSCVTFQVSLVFINPQPR